MGFWGPKPKIDAKTAPILMKHLKDQLEKLRSEFVMGLQLKEAGNPLGNVRLEKAKDLRDEIVKLLKNLL